VVVGWRACRRCASRSLYLLGSIAKSFAMLSLEVKRAVERGIEERMRAGGARAEYPCGQGYSWASKTELASKLLA
jgi:hypothetical protein